MELRVQKQTLHLWSIFAKGAKRIQWCRESSLFNKWCRYNWIFTLKRMKLEPYLINSKRIKDLQWELKLQLLEENLGYFAGLGFGNGFLHMTWKTQTVQEKKKKQISWTSLKLKLGLPWWLSGKESNCQCRRHGFDPWSRKIPHASEQLSPCATTTECVF